MQWRFVKRGVDTGWLKWRIREAFSGGGGDRERIAMVEILGGRMEMRKKSKGSLGRGWIMEALACYAHAHATR